MAGRRTILMVEDEESITVPLAEALDREGFYTQVAGTVAEAIQRAEEQMPDLVLLDVMLPDGSGYDAARRLRERSHVPIIMLTARGEETDRVVGLELGADDYIVKPFSPRELAARVRAALRRVKTEATAQPAPSDLYRGKHLVADFDAVSVLIDDRPIQLTRREFELLRYLVQNRNRVLSRDRLLERVWGYEHVVETRSVDVHVGRLRGKLGAAAHQIETVVGLGYRFVEQ
jgi:DNA-binding response OmpR family regulator